MVKRGKFTGKSERRGMLQFYFRSRNAVPSSVYRLGLRPLIPQVSYIDEFRSDFHLAPDYFAALWRFWANGSRNMRFIVLFFTRN